MEWIKTEDELPEVRKLVQVWGPSLIKVQAGYWASDGTCYVPDKGWWTSITHWAPLLDPPVEITTGKCCMSCQNFLKSVNRTRCLLHKRDVFSHQVCESYEETPLVNPLPEIVEAKCCHNCTYQSRIEGSHCMIHSQAVAHTEYCELWELNKI